jgi:hypothetical protein
VHDAIELEKRGVPTVAIHTTVFMNSADAHAKAYGLPEYTSIAVEHPVSGRPPDEVRAKADAVLKDVVGILTGARSAA